MRAAQAHDRGARRTMVQASLRDAGLFPAGAESAHRPPSRTISRNWSSGSRRVFVVRSDGLDDEIEFVGAVDFPGDAVILAWSYDSGFG